MIHPTAFIHDKALVDAGARIGARTRVWGFSHVLGGACIGADCNICEQVFIENDVTVKCGVQLWGGLRVGDDVHIGPNVTFTNDKYPKSRNSGYTCLPTHIEAGASIGGGAVILPGLTIGAGAMVGAGAVVTRSVPPGVTVVGNPARILRITPSRPAATSSPVDPPPPDHPAAT